MSFMVHCNFENWSQNRHIQSNLLEGRERGVTKKEYSVYALDNVDNYGRPLKAPFYKEWKTVLLPSNKTS